MTTLTRCTVLLIALCALALQACGNITQKVHDTPPANAAQAVQHAIDETNVALAAAFTTITDQYNAKLMTWSDFKDVRATLNSAAKHRDEATTLLKTGDPTSAEGRLKLATALLTVVQGRIAELKTGGKP